VNDRRCIYCKRIVPDGQGVIVRGERKDWRGTIVVAREVSCATCRAPSTRDPGGGERVIRSTRGLS
jgi:hypothetical protein